MVKIGPRFPRRRSTPQAPPPPVPKKALLIGINYTDADPNSDFPSLRRAQSDTEQFRDLLIKHYDYSSENITMMLDKNGVEPDLWPTRANILREIRTLVQGAQSGSRFVFFYSGHSGQVESPNRSEEEDGLDEFMVPVDHFQILSRLMAAESEGRRASHRRQVKKCMIIDNKLRKMLVNPLPVGAYLTAIFDSCHSGTMLDLDHYLCNNVYYPWKTPGFRRHKTMWQQVRRKDGQRMSQSGVQVVTKKYPDSKKRAGSSSSQPSREGSKCSVRIYQRRRVSEGEIEVINTSVGISDTQYSVQSRRASVQFRSTSSSLAQVVEHDAFGHSVDSLSDGEGGDTEHEEDMGASQEGEGSGVVFGPRCASPTSIRTCNGWCEADVQPEESATVMSISSCQDTQRTWESKNGSFTQWLVKLLRKEPHQPVGKFLQELTYKMYDHARKTHRWSQRRKDSWKLKHPQEGLSTAVEHADTELGKVDVVSENHEHPLDLLDFVDVPGPQLGAQHRLDLSQPMNL